MTSTDTRGRKHVRFIWLSLNVYSYIASEVNVGIDGSFSLPEMFERSSKVKPVFLEINYHTILRFVTTGLK
jgi:hypothetical protein